MAFCGNCRFQNPDDARFCGSCGADLTQQQIGNVESIVNESPGAATPDNTPMGYVPLPESEPVVPDMSQQEAQPSMQPATPPMSQPMESPVSQPIETPVSQPVASPPPPIPPQPIVPPQPAVPPTPQPQPQPQPQPIPPKSSGGGAGKTCLGCGCAALIVLLLIIGGACWWFYSYYKQHNEDIDEVLEWVDKSHAEWEEQNGVGNEDPEIQTYNGQTLKELAEQQGFPSVTYSELPQEGPSYFYDDEEESIALRVNYLKFKEGDYIGVATLSDRKGGEVRVARISPCGCSIYRLSFPQDENLEVYMFVYKAARRIIIGSNGETKEFTLPDDDD